MIGLPLSQLGKWERGQKDTRKRRRRLGERCVRWEETESKGKQCFEEGMDKARHQMGEENWERGKASLLSSKRGMERGTNVSGLFKALQFC